MQVDVSAAFKPQGHLVLPASKSPELKDFPQGESSLTVWCLLPGPPTLSLANALIGEVQVQMIKPELPESWERWMPSI